jgi:uracil-DNA glycosylase
MRPDARKTLDVLRGEWESCTKCPLGVQRDAYGGSFVFGEGRRRGIMIIGEGPGVEEDREGRPFIGKSGELLRRILEGFSFQDYYLTNLVTCRSCEHKLDENNQPMFRNQRGRKGPQVPWLIDTPPKPSEWGQCIARLYEEIYLVDPVLIVSVGGTAAEALMGKPVTITKIHGTPVEISVPGAGYDAVLTEKKKEWYHKVRGEVVAPVRQSEVKYLLVPTLHPAYVLRKLADKDPVNSPFRLLAEDIRRAIKIYEEYIRIVFQAPQPNVAKSDVDWTDIENHYMSHKEDA